MKKISEMSKEKAQRILFITVLILVFGVFFIALSLIEPNEGNEDPNNEDPTDNPDDHIPVVYETILVPFSGEKETIRKFWSKDQSNEDKLISVITVGESTYTMSRGISYANDDKPFEVLASLSGTVTDVKDSPMYGKTITIEHEGNITTVYSSLSQVSVEKDDKVEQGDILGITGTCDWDQAAKNHVYFQILVNGTPYNPVNLIGKKTNALGIG